MTASCNSTDNSESAAFNSLLRVLLSNSVSIITVNELSSIRENVTVLDAREIEEYNISRIPSSVHVGYEKFDLDKIEHIAKDEKIIVYCSVGYRSEKIGERLEEAGYSNVKNLYGGIFAWVNQHQPIVNNHGKTHTVHPYGLFWSAFITNDSTSTSYTTGN